MRNFLFNFCFICIWLFFVFSSFGNIVVGYSHDESGNLRAVTGGGESPTQFQIKTYHTEKTGGDGPDIMFGTDKNDILDGRDGDDYLYGKKGSDKLLGGGGNDHAYGGDGNDDIFGGIGDDYLAGENGDDVIHGGPGNDFINGGIGNNSLYGGPGADTFVRDYSQTCEAFIASIKDFNHSEGDTLDGCFI